MKITDLILDTIKKHSDISNDSIQGILKNEYGIVVTSNDIDVIKYCKAVKIKFLGFKTKSKSMISVIPSDGFFSRPIDSTFDYNGKKLIVVEAGPLDFCIQCFFCDGWSDKCERNAVITGECKKAYTNDKKDRLFKILK